MMKKIILLSLIISVVAISGCKSCKSRDEALIGTQKYPLKIGFMPSADKTSMEKGAALIAAELAKSSGLLVEPVLADNYLQLITGLADKKIDVAFINPLGSLLAHDWAKAEPVFQLMEENGKLSYRSAVIARADSGIKKIEDLNGKSFAYTDPFSMGGYLMPLSVFDAKKITPKSTSFTGSYASVVEAIYGGNFDAGAIYYNDRDPDGRIHDARLTLINKYPDTLDKVSVIFTSDPIPTPPIVFRNGLSATVKEKMKRAFGLAGLDPNVIAALNKMYDARGIAVADEKAYDGIRNILRALGKSTEEAVPGAVEFYKKNMWDIAPDR